MTAGTKSVTASTFDWSSMRLRWSRIVTDVIMLQMPGRSVGHESSVLRHDRDDWTRHCGANIDAGRMAPVADLQQAERTIIVDPVGLLRRLF